MPVADPYLSTQVLTASPYRLHLMVVEGAIRCARTGAEALESKDYEAAHLALSESRDFATELIGGLNEKYDTDLTKRMKQLFFVAYINLAEGERDRDLTKVQHALNILTMHHETWLELGKKLQAEAAPQTPASTTPPATKGSGPSRAWSA